MSSDFCLFSSGKMTEHFDVINYSIVIFFMHLLLKNIMLHFCISKLFPLFLFKHLR